VRLPRQICCRSLYPEHCRGFVREKDVSHGLSNSRDPGKLAQRRPLLTCSLVPIGLMEMLCLKVMKAWPNRVGGATKLYQRTQSAAGAGRLGCVCFIASDLTAMPDKCCDSIAMVFIPVRAPTVHTLAGCADMPTPCPFVCEQKQTREITA
jgi:hypothetical protein